MMIMPRKPIPNRKQAPNRIPRLALSREVDAEPEAQLKWWAYPRKWLGEEKFYQDVATRFISGILVALFVFLFALASGYISSPSGKEWLRSVVIIVVYLLALLGPFVAMGYNPERYADRPKHVRIFRKTFALICTLLVVAVVLDQWLYPFIPWVWAWKMITAPWTD